MTIPNLGHPKVVPWAVAEPFVMDGSVHSLEPGHMLMVSPSVVSRQRMLVHAQARYVPDEGVIGKPQTIDLMVPLDVYVDWLTVMVGDPVDEDQLLVD